MKTLIVTKDLQLAGGVTNFYRIFFKNYEHKDVNVELFVQGLSKPQKTSQAPEYSFKSIIDIIRFGWKLLRDNEIKVIHLNPSYFTVPVIRDAPYILLAWVLRKKVLILFHGWDPKFHERMKRSNFQWAFRKIYSKASRTFVLANDFKKDLQRIGFKNIYLAKTFFDGDLFNDWEPKKNAVPKLLYMGRMQEGKGIFVILEALRRLKKSGVPFKMEYAGWFVDAEEEKRFFDTLTKYALEEDVTFIGYIEGREKVEKLYVTDIFIYPSYYTEGCPTVVIEALAGGCYIISTDVAALKEVVKEGFNGSLLAQKDPNDLYEKLAQTLKNHEDMVLKRLSIREDAFKMYESRRVIDLFHDAYLEIAGLTGGKESK